MALWFVGGWATAWMMKAPLAACGISGGACALLIGVLDRGMMAFLSRKGNSLLGLFARVVLALAASLIFAHPSVFYLANGVIEREIGETQNQLVEERKEELRPQLENAMKRLAASLKTFSEAATVAGEAFALKDAELKAKREETAKAHATMDSEARGLLENKKKGEGENYTRLKEIHAAAKKREEEVLGEYGAAKTRTTAADAALKSAAENAVKDSEVIRLEADLAAVTKQIRSQNLDDPFSRFEALHRLIARDWSNGNYSLGLAYAVVCVVLLGMEMVPLGLKLGSRGGEHSLKVAASQFKAEKDYENLETVYPAISMQLIDQRLKADLKKEGLRLDLDVTMDNVRKHRNVARDVMLEQQEVFEMAEEVVRRVPKKARPEHREFAELLAKQLIKSFMASIEVVLPGMKADAPTSTPPPQPPTP